MPSSSKRAMLSTLAMLVLGLTTHSHISCFGALLVNTCCRQVFTNFWVKKNLKFRELPNPATSQTFADVAAALTGLPQGIVSYIISHIDLNDALAPEVSMKKIAEIGL